MRRLSLENSQLKYRKFDGGGDGVVVDKNRLSMVRAVIVSLFLVIGVRLVFLQAVEGAQLRRRSDDNRIYVRSVEPQRGTITDRNGSALVVNEPRYLLIADEENKLFVEPVEISREEVLASGLGESSRLARGVRRFYPEGKVVAHAVGYVGEVGPREVEEGVYGPGETVGKSGVEYSYNSELAGSAGNELIEVNVGGVLVRRVAEYDPVGGSDVEVGIDLGLQRVLYSALEGRKGSAVASDPATGEILAIVSSPSYDPNVFVNVPEFAELSENESRGIDDRGSEVVGLLTSEDQPLVNRAISGAYPPGSVFKVVPAIAGLETEKVTLETEIEDEGQIIVDSYSFANWYFSKYGKTDGMVNMTKALQRSNDVYFYRVGEKVGAEVLADWSEMFGLGRKTEIDLPGEVGGLVPSPVWKERARNERWFLGNTYHFAIGQGDLLVTPLQLNQMMGVIANGGRLCKPFLVRKVGGEEVRRGACSELGINDEHVDVVREGLVAACMPGGTGVPFFEFDLAKYGQEYEGLGRNRVACKTGTAQFFDPDDRTHAWFGVFAPAQNPEIQITVLLEGAGEGSEEAAPVAFEAIKYWFESKKG